MEIGPHVFQKSRRQTDRHGSFIGPDMLCTVSSSVFEIFLLMMWFWLILLKTICN